MVMDFAIWDQCPKMLSFPNSNPSFLVVDWLAAMTSVNAKVTWSPCIPPANLVSWMVYPQSQTDMDILQTIDTLCVCVRTKLEIRLVWIFYREEKVTKLGACDRDRWLLRVRQKLRMFFIMFLFSFSFRFFCVRGEGEKSYICSTLYYEGSLLSHSHSLIHKDPFWCFILEVLQEW